MNKNIILSAIILLFLLASCHSSKDVAYLQDVEQIKVEDIVLKYEPQIQTDDLLSIIVSSKNPELTEPFNLQKSTVITNYNKDNELGFLVDLEGNIDYPVFGKISVKGLTRLQLQELIKEKLIENDLIKDPIVTIQFLNFKVSVLGEVNKPGSFKVSGDRITLFEALSLAGDLTIYGRRDQVVFIRESDGKRIISRRDIRTSDIMNTSFYYLQQNDIIYVEPNNIRAQQSGINQNISVSAIVSVASLLASLAILIFK